MRKLLLAGIAAVAAMGCQGTTSAATPADDNDWTLYADDAALAPSDNGAPWCDGLQIRAVATFGGKHIATPPSPGLTPSWRAPLLTLSEDDFARGILVDVLAQCNGGGAPFSIGAVTMRAGREMVEAGGVQLESFGSVQSLRLDFVAATQSEGTSPPYVAYAAGPDDGDDPVDIYSGGACGGYCPDYGDDPGSAAPDAPDAPGVDPGDDGGDTGGDDGGDDGSDGTSKRNKRPPAAQHTQAQTAARLTP